MDIKFMTAHASKGLQRDFVFLLCCSGGLKGFPSAIPEEPLLGLLLPEVERMPHAEERRLFYVAMTRCKKKLFFVVDQSRPSRFMYELHDRICPNIFRGVKLPPQCPNCGEALRLRHTGSDPSARFTGAPVSPTADTPGHASDTIGTDFHRVSCSPFGPGVISPVVSWTCSLVRRKQ